MRIPAVFALLLLGGCATQNGSLGVVRPTEPAVLPIAIVLWCGDEGPAQLDLRGGGIDLHYRANRVFDGGAVEVNLADPGPDWTVERGIVDGGTPSGATPRLDYSGLRLSAGTTRTEGDRRAEADLGDVEFSMRGLPRADVVTVTDNKYSYVPRAEFTADC